MECNRSDLSDSNPHQLRVRLRQFDSGEKRQWPLYLSELITLFQSPAFAKSAQRKPHRVVEDCGRVFARVLTTKLFPDISEQTIKAIAALSTALGSQCRELFVWAFEMYRSTIADESRIILIRSIALIVHQNHIGLSDHLPNLLNRTKRIFETVETCDLLLELIRIFLAATLNNSRLLQNHFCDVVDILIGWHFDCAHSPTIMQQLRSCLLDFDLLWLSNYDFAFTLLAHFIDDFESHFTQFHHQTSIVECMNATNSFTTITVDSDNRLAKLGSLIYVHLTVIRCVLKRSFQSDHSNRAPISNVALVDSLRRFLVPINLLLLKFKHETLVIAMNQSILFTICYLNKRSMSIVFEPLVEHVQIYICRLLCTLKQSSKEYITSTLQLMIAFVRIKGNLLDPSLLRDWLHPDSELQQIKFIPSRQLQQNLYTLHHELLSTANIPLLEIVYNCILLQLEAALSTLLNESIFICDSSSTTPCKIKVPEMSAVAIVYSCITSLTRLAVTKQSQIGLWALKPTFFDLFATQMRLSHNRFALHYPSIQLLALRVLYSHCHLHSHYVSTSSLITCNDFSSKKATFKLSFTMDSPSSTYFEKLLQIFFDFLKQDDLPLVNKSFIVNWLFEIVRQCKSTSLIRLLQHILFQNVLRQIALQAFYADPKISARCACIILHCLHHCGQHLPDDIRSMFHQSCFKHLDSTDSALVDKFAQVMALLPIKVQRPENSLLRELMLPSQKRQALEVYTQYRVLMRSERDFLFNSAAFRALWTLLVKCTFEPMPSNTFNLICSRLIRLFESYEARSLPETKCTTSRSNSNRADDRSIHTWTSQSHHARFWCCWQLIRYCVVNKLRTPLGKPPETFTRIELLAKQHALAISRPAEVTPAVRQKSLSQVRFLMHVLETLEKMMSVAIQKSGSAQTFSISAPIRTFFQTNRITCSEWLQRFRNPLISLASISVDPASVWRHCERLLSYSNDKNQLIEPIVANYANALIQLRSPQSIVGLRNWCQSHNQNNFNWLNGAIKEAAGNYETALIVYTEKLNEQFNSSETLLQKKCIKEFLSRRIVLCNMQLFTFSFDSTLAHQIENIGGQDYRQLDILRNYFNSNSNDVASPIDLQRYRHLLNWDVNQIQYESEKSLISCFDRLSIGHIASDLEGDLSRLQKTCCNIINELPDANALINQRFQILLRCANYIEKVFKPTNDDYPDGEFGPWIDWKSPFVHDFDVSTLIYAQKWWLVLEKHLKWSQQKQIISTLHPESDFIISQVARKSKNLQTAQSHLNLFQKGLALNFEHGFILNAPIATVYQHLDSSKLHQVLKLRYEQSKLLHCKSEFNKCFDILFCTFRSTCTVWHSLSAECQHVWSKIALKLHKLISNNWSNQSSYCLDWADRMATFLNTLSSVESKLECFDASQLSLNQLEEIQLRLLSLNTEKNPNMSKNWHSLAVHCYESATKYASIEDDQPESVSECNIQLLRMSMQAYFKFLNFNCMSDHEYVVVTATLRLLQMISMHSNVLREAIDNGLSTSPIHPWKMVILQLFALLPHSDIYVRHCVHELLRQIGQLKPHLILYPAVSGALVNETNPSAHFKLFSSLSQDGHLKLADDFNVEEDQFPMNAKDMNPTRVRSYSDSPSLKTSLRNPVTSSMLTVVNARNETKSTSDTEIVLVSKPDCHQALLSSLPAELVTQVKRFVIECERITLLWDELWLATLLSKFSQMKRIVTNLQQQHDVLNTANTLQRKTLSAKELEVFKPIQVLLKQAFAITSRKPETPHEQWFQKTHSSHIQCLIQSLKRPVLDISQAPKLLNMYQRSIQLLQTKPAHICFSAMSTSSSANVKSQMLLDLISPTLAAMKDTRIPIPNSNNSSTSTDEGCVQIERIHRTCQTLQAKTKPKKLAFYGSNGKLYGFLLKGEDNLHLDERIMQLLQITNQMFASYARKLNASERLSWSTMRARHYSVTPISLRSGLIQWVNGSSLFSFYNRHMAYVKMEQSTDTSLKDDASNRTRLKSSEKCDSKIITSSSLTKIALQSPSEVFNRKLKSKGLQVGDRSNWPPETLIEIWRELKAETPSDLISNELWCSASHAHEYWSLSKRFVQSNAIMCMIGYLIGLGDRHLDNLLLDLNTGEIIHIDYNICFERGRCLRVPERVPCRLTNNIVHAFGMSGLEGLFRDTCFDVLQLLYRQRHTFLTLLQTSVDESLLERTDQLPYADSVLPTRERLGSWRETWRRVGMKLEGQNSDGLERWSPAEHVQFILNQATDPNNLARMFEGWTAWV